MTGVQSRMKGIKRSKWSKITDDQGFSGQAMRLCRRTRYNYHVVLPVVLECTRVSGLRLESDIEFLSPSCRAQGLKAGFFLQSTSRIDNLSQEVLSQALLAQWAPECVVSTFVMQSRSLQIK